MEFFMNFAGIRRILKKFQYRNQMTLGFSEFFKNSDAVCFSDKIPTEEVEVDTKIKFDGL